MRNKGGALFIKLHTALLHEHGGIMTRWWTKGQIKSNGGISPLMKYFSHCLHFAPPSLERKEIPVFIQLDVKHVGAVCTVSRDDLVYPHFVFCG